MKKGYFLSVSAVKNCTVKKREKKMKIQCVLTFVLLVGSVAALDNTMRTIACIKCKNVNEFNETKLRELVSGTFGNENFTLDDLDTRIDENSTTVAIFLKQPSWKYSAKDLAQAVLLVNTTKTNFFAPFQFISVETKDETIPEEAKVTDTSAKEQMQLIGYILIALCGVMFFVVWGIMYGKTLDDY